MENKFINLYVGDTLLGVCSSLTAHNGGFHSDVITLKSDALSNLGAKFQQTCPDVPSLQANGRNLRFSRWGRMYLKDDCLLLEDVDLRETDLE